jgi:sugar O-acyltransferase (sialic acid O-acetyltransferase NeuD family)
MNDNGRLILLGGGGHAAIVAESARAAGFSIDGFLDDDQATRDAMQPLGLEHLGGIAALETILELRAREIAVHAAIGDPAFRRQWLERSADRRSATIIDPSARVSPTANIADGAFIGPHAIVNARATIGRGAIINSGAIVEHDCTVNAFCHIAPGAVLGGACSVGPDSLVGSGAVVRPLTHVGANVTIGVNAAVVDDVGDAVQAVGVPAKPVR